MKNKHLEHPEDSILNKGREGALSILKFLKDKNSTLSVKYDGAPAIVWGINPENERFFVGTKAVFNKREKYIKINYTHHDIEVNHGNKPNVASILHLCLDHLPRIDGVYQGDFIGYGGTDTYKPNVIEYSFHKERITKFDMVFAQHSHYRGDYKTLKDLTVQYNMPYTVCGGNTYFVNITAEREYRALGLDLLLGLAEAAVKFVKFPTEEEGKKIKIAVNKFIREGRDLIPSELSKETGYHANLFHLYNFIREIKHKLMEGIKTFEDVTCVIDYDNIGIVNHEGFVMSNQHGTYKLVKRNEFSYANFNADKSWSQLPF